MAEQTTMFQAVDYMVALCRANAPVGTYVYDGPETGDAAARIRILIAYSDADGAPAIEGQAGTSDFGFPVENYTVDCSIAIDDGDTDLSAKRAEVRAIFNTLVGAVRSDRSLGGLIKPPGLAEISGFVYTQDQYEAEGSAVVAAFSVAVTEAVIWGG